MRQIGLIYLTDGSYKPLLAANLDSYAKITSLSDALLLALSEIVFSILERLFTNGTRFLIGNALISPSNTLKGAHFRLFSTNIPDFRPDID